MGRPGREPERAESGQEETSATLDRVAATGRNNAARDYRQQIGGTTAALKFRGGRAAACTQLLVAAQQLWREKAARLPPASPAATLSPQSERRNVFSRPLPVYTHRRSAMTTVSVVSQQKVCRRRSFVALTLIGIGAAMYHHHHPASYALTSRLRPSHHAQAQWTSQLSECCAQPGGMPTCCYATFCPCCAAGDVATAAKRDYCMSCCIIPILCPIWPCWLAYDRQASLRPAERRAAALRLVCPFVCPPPSQLSRATLPPLSCRRSSRSTISRTASAALRPRSFASGATAAC